MRATRVKAAFAAVAALAVLVGTPRAQTARSPATIKIVLINGKNGKPIRNGRADVWIGPAEPIKPAIWRAGKFVGDEKYAGLDPLPAGPDGTVTFTIEPPPESWIDVIAQPPFAAKQCEPHIYYVGLAYRLTDVIQHGIVSDNVCGKAHSTPTPGTLIIYLRPETFWEKLSR